MAATAVVMGGLASAGSTATANDASAPHVTVREDGGVYTVAAQFEVSQPPSVALAVLADYEQIPRFMPNVKTSVVRERGDGRTLVEQEAVSSVMMFSKRVHLLLEVRETPDAVRFRDLSGRSFTRYEGAWTLAPRAGRTRISYELTARPAFSVPEFMITRLFKRDARQMIEQLRAEMALRARIW